MAYLWGIDLGGTKAECVVLNAAHDHRVIVRERISTEAEKGYKHVLLRIKKLIDETSEKSGFWPDRLGMGTPGSIDPDTGMLINSNSVILNGMLFKKDIEDVLGIPVTIANDANCFALAETKMGAIPKYCPDAKVVFGVIMGTGVGGGAVVEGKVINGRHGIAGEWGHNFMDASGGSCYCGKAGCVETVISGTALEKYYEQIAGNKLKLKEIAERYEKGIDQAAAETMNRLIHFFGLGLSCIVNIIDPDIIVIGGGVGNLGILYTEGVQETERYVFNTNFHTIIKKPVLGDSAGVFGAAFLVADQT